MELKTIKISDETYRELCRVLGELQTRHSHRLSIDEAVRYIISQTERGKKITDFAGAWKMSDKEAEEMFASLAKWWRRWKLPRSA